jgi:hypothetical protein
VWRNRLDAVVLGQPLIEVVTVVGAKSDWAPVRSMFPICAVPPKFPLIRHFKVFVR